MSRYNLDDEDYGYIGGTGTYRVPDKDVYRRTLTTFNSVHNYYKQRLVVRSFRDRRLQQPHFTSLRSCTPPFAFSHNPADGICSHFLRRGLIKPNKTQMSTAIWSADARWLVLGTVTGEVALWEGDTLKVHKVVSLPAHKVFDGEDIIDSVPITSMAWNNHGNLLVSGDRDGLIQYCDETLREVKKIPEAHTGPIRGLSFSPLDLKLVSCSDDGLLHIWAKGEITPESTLSGHLSDVKTVDWHPYRSLIASGSRDTTIRLWDPKQNSCLSVLSNHKKQVNCVSWNNNGNWLLSGSRDGTVKLYDIRMMKEIESFRGHNSDVCSLAWHPHYERLFASGGYNGSIIYWLANHNQAPHTIIADAHRQSIDIMAFHPAGHCLATASHDGILKFWCREPPGAKLDGDEVVKEFQDNPIVAHGPLKVGSNNIIPLQSMNLLNPQQPGGGGGGGGLTGQMPSFTSSSIPRSAQQSTEDSHYGPGMGRSSDGGGGGGMQSRFQRGGGGRGGGGGGDGQNLSAYMPRKRFRDT